MRRPLHHQFPYDYSKRRHHYHHGHDRKHQYVRRMSAVIMATLVAVAVGWTMVMARFFLASFRTQLMTLNNPLNNPLRNLTTSSSSRSRSRKNHDTIYPNKKTTQQPCRYDGHCPMSMTCSAAAVSITDHLRSPDDYDDNDAHFMPGLCQPIAPVTDDSAFILQVNGNNTSSAQWNGTTTILEACYSACEYELRMDEHFYHQAWPEITSRHATNGAVMTGRPASGCILHYRRLKDRPDEWQALHARDVLLRPFFVAQSVQTWEGKTRFRHLKRVDPVLQPENQNSSDNDDNETLWMAYCTAPCRTNDDCQPPSSSSSSSSPTSMLGFPFVCTDGACQRNEAWWSRKTRAQQLLLQETQGGSEMLIVTAADAHFYRPVMSLIASAQYWAPQSKVVVYNLGGGMDRAQKQSILEQPNVLSLEWQNGIPQQYPHHVHQDLQNYAWKPIIIQEALQKYQMILWLDAGSTITGPIDKLQDIVRRTGLFLVKGQDVDMKLKSHPLTYAWFNFSKATLRAGPHFSGNTQAYLSPSRYVDTIVHANAACALDANCIAPKIGPTGNGSTTNIGNHRFDQTSLSICAYHPHVRAPHYTEYLAASRSQVRGGLPDQASFRFIWTSRGEYDFANALARVVQNNDNNTASSSSLIALVDDALDPAGAGLVVVVDKKQE
jgi:Protein of unknown function (DUF1647)